MDDDERPSVCGYMATVDSLLVQKLGISPDYTAEELQQAVSKSTDPEVKEIMSCFALLCDIPIPEIYRNNQENMYCLYNKDECKEASRILSGLWKIMLKEMPGYVFRKKRFRLKDTEILYEDCYQIVIAKEVYDKHKNNSTYDFL